MGTCKKPKTSQLLKKKPGRPQSLEKKLEYCLRITKNCLDTAKYANEGGILILFATNYYNDALYYSKKDPETALEAVAYAHGFIDAGVLLGLIKIPKYHLTCNKEQV